MDILYDLYYDRIFPFEEICPTQPEYQTLSEELSSLENQLRGRLSEEDMKLYLRAERAESSLLSLEVAQAFVEGFRLGGNILLSTLSSRRS